MQSFEKSGEGGLIGWAESLKIQKDLIARAVGADGSAYYKIAWIERHSSNFRVLIESDQNITTLIRDNYEAGLEEIERRLVEMPVPTEKAA